MERISDALAWLRPARFTSVPASVVHHPVLEGDEAMLLRYCEYVKCRKTFEVKRTNGRPQRFCSAACRTKDQNSRKNPFGPGCWPYTAEALKELCEIYESGVSSIIIAERMGVVCDTVLRALHAAGVEVRENTASTQAKRSGDGRFHSNGYVWLRIEADDPLRCMARTKFGNAKVVGYALEHRIVMARHLGRPLRDFENVHHKNGITDQNDLGNLELWVKAQPAGQRPADLAAFVAEFYPDELVKLGWSS